MKKRKLRLTPGKLVALGFAAVILLGAGLLCCPFSSKSGEWTPFIDGLFTATSCACVTGLAVVDTAAHWSDLGKAIMLILIQIGGLGTMTIITAVTVLVKKRVTLRDSRMLMQSAGTLQMGGVAALLKRIFLGTLLCEAVGAVLLATRLVPIFDWGRGLLKSVFHSVSAFCNAGFDTFGDYNGGASLSAFSKDPVVLFTVMALVVVGGLGFIVWDDLIKNKFRFKKYAFHTKIVLSFSAGLLLLGAVVFFFTERNAAFSHMGTGEQLLNALFQSVTPRTAGFATVPMETLSAPGSMLTMALMLVGGSPGSTAGGMKTTVLAVLIINLAASSRRSAQPTAFGRSLDSDTVRQASAVASIYILLSVIGIMVLCALEPCGLVKAAFEITSALGTVGLSAGLTPTLGIASKGLLVALMYAGRIGGLTLALVISEKSARVPASYPAGRLLIG